MRKRGTDDNKYLELIAMWLRTVEVKTLTSNQLQEDNCKLLMLEVPKPVTTDVSYLYNVL